VTDIQGKIEIARESVELRKKKYYFYVPLGVLKENLHLSIARNFVTQTPWSTFRADSPVTSDRNL